MEFFSRRQALAALGGGVASMVSNALPAMAATENYGLEFPKTRAARLLKLKAGPVRVLSSNSDSRGSQLQRGAASTFRVLNTEQGLTVLDAIDLAVVKQSFLNFRGSSTGYSRVLGFFSTDIFDGYIQFMFGKGGNREAFAYVNMSVGYTNTVATLGDYIFVFSGSQCAIIDAADTDSFGQAGILRVVDLISLGSAGETCVEAVPLGNGRLLIALEESDFGIRLAVLSSQGLTFGETDTLGTDLGYGIACFGNPRSNKGYVKFEGSNRLGGRILNGSLGVAKVLAPVVVGTVDESVEGLRVQSLDDGRVVAFVLSYAPNNDRYYVRSVCWDNLGRLAGSPVLEFSRGGGMQQLRLQTIGPNSLACATHVSDTEGNYYALVLRYDW